MNGLAAQYVLFVAEIATVVLAVIGLPERLRHSAQSAWDGIWQPPYPLG